MVSEIKKYVLKYIFLILCAVNVKSIFHCVKKVFPYIKKQSAGVIVNLGILAGLNSIGHPYDGTLTCHLTRT